MNFKKLFILILIINILSIGGIAFAQETATTNPTFTPANLALRAKLSNDAAALTWEITDKGTAPNGYKIVWSIFPNPEYPIRENDYFNSAPNSSTTEMDIDYFLNEGLYYARVCVFDGAEQCISYSNEITFTVTEVPAEIEGENPCFCVTEIVEDGSGTGTSDGLMIDKLPEIELPEDIYNNPYKDAIEYMYQNAIVSGYPDGTFKPKNKINRAEFTKIIAEATIPESTIENCLNQADNSNIFNDVNTADWYAKYVCAAKEQGIIGGYPDGTFGPEKEISFVEASKIITLGVGEYIYETDIWYQAYVEKLADKHAIPPTIENAEYLITRGEMSEMLYRLKAIITDRPFLTYQEVIESV